MNTCLSPVKINLGIEVPFRYASGYHHIISLFVPLDIGDRLSFNLVEQPGFHLRWKSNLNAAQTEVLRPAFDSPENNILLKTYTTMQQHPAIASLLQNRGLEVFIEKNIPSPSGLGAGSSNAACLALYLAEKADLPLAEIEEAALQIGSDVPFFLYKQPAIISGTGEIEKLVEIPPISGIIGIPPFGMSTAEMYRQLGLKPLAFKSKSAVQTDKSLRSILVAGLAASESLLDTLWAEAQGSLQITRFENSILQAHEDGILLKNAFLKAAKVCQADKARQIETAMQSLVASLNDQLKTEKPVKTLFYSLSGSGSAFYAFISHGGRKNYSHELSLVIDQLRSSMPDFNWFSFASLT